MREYFALCSNDDIMSFSSQALSTDSVERLPVFNKTARRNYEVTQGADDWCVPSREPLDLAVFRLAKWKGAASRKDIGQFYDRLTWVNGVGHSDYMAEPQLTSHCEAT